MNCCDDYGKCTQGYNCPAREKHCEKERSLVKEVLIDLLLAVAGAGVITGVVAYFIGYQL